MIQTSYGEVCRQTAENDVSSIRLGRQSCLHGWRSCHGLMSATLARAVARFSCAKKKAQRKFLFSFFLCFFIFPSSFWRRVPRLAASYWPILVKQILNQWMNLKKRVLLFRPNQTGDSAETVKPQGNPALYKKSSTTILDINCPKWLERVKQVESTGFF